MKFTKQNIYRKFINIFKNRKRLFKLIIVFSLFVLLCIIVDKIWLVIKQNNRENREKNYIGEEKHVKSVREEVSQEKVLDTFFKTDSVIERKNVHVKTKPKSIVVKESDNELQVKLKRIIVDESDKKIETKLKRIIVEEDDKEFQTTDVNNLLKENTITETPKLFVKKEENYRENVFDKMEPEKKQFQISSLDRFDKDVKGNRALEDAINAGDSQFILESYSSCMKHQLKQNNKKFRGYSFPEIEEKIRKHCYKIIFGNENGNICKFPSTKLVGPLLVDFEPISVEELQKELTYVKEGGWWKPSDCIPRHKVAIIIPFRDRDAHLTVLLRQLHAILKRQELMYRIIVIEQVDEYPFNRGKLMNVGYSESLKMFPFTCLVFHDVDLIPENDLNDYGCPTSPRHLSCAVDKFDYVLPYPGIFGGVEMFLNNDFEKVNGFPNGYWGWGAEDDNLYKRISEHGFQLTRPSLEEGRYKMIKHEESQEKPPNRIDKLNNAQQEFQTDGISSLQYKVIDVMYEKYFTKIKVDLNLEGDIMY